MKSKLVKSTLIAIVGLIVAAGFIVLGISTFVGSRVGDFGKLSDVIEMTELAKLSPWDDNADAVIRVSFSDALREIDNGIYGADLADGMELLPPKEALDVQKMSLLRLGGEDFSRFDMSDFSIADGDGRKVIPAFGETLAWFNEAGTDVVLQINMLASFCDDAGCQSSPELAVEYLRRLREQYGVRVRYVSLDHEPMNWDDVHGDIVREECTCERYCRMFSEYAKAIKLYDSSIVIIGLDGTEESDWTGEFLDFCAAYEERVGMRILDMLSLHPSFENGGEAERYIAATKELIADRYPGTAVAFGEYRVEADGMDETAQALELAVVLGRMADGNVGLACYSTLLGSGGSAMIDDSGMTYDGVCYGEKRPSFYTFHMMSNFLRGSLVGCSCTDDALDVYAVDDGGVHRIIVVNTTGNSVNCGFSSDDRLLDSCSRVIAARSVTVFESGVDAVYAYTCGAENMKK